MVRCCKVTKFPPPQNNEPIFLKLCRKFRGL
nr:MAG TPA: hypothetical protein [Caudoviricetes sp.]DAU36332.1 MAG TPA: hypothetical protein [Caudoviricetes sp.]